MAGFVLSGDFLIGVACLAGGVFLEKKFGLYDKVMAPINWIKAKF